MADTQGSADRAALKYTTEHEWVLVTGHTATVGITDYAAGKLGDVVFAELPEVGAAVSRGKVVGEIESTKSVGEVFAPMDGIVVETNDAVVAKPELINDDPFEAGWLIKVTFTELPELLSFDEYSALVAE
jgi:glycine cleavage system H protein